MKIKTAATNHAQRSSPFSVIALVCKIYLKKDLFTSPLQIHYKKY